jgi:hypothetical protein
MASAFGAEVLEDLVKRPGEPRHLALAHPFDPELVDELLDRLVETPARLASAITDPNAYSARRRGCQKAIGEVAALPQLRELPPRRRRLNASAVRDLRADSCTNATPIEIANPTGRARAAPARNRFRSPLRSSARRRSPRCRSRRPGRAHGHPAGHRPPRRADRRRPERSARRARSPLRPNLLLNLGDECDINVCLLDHVKHSLDNGAAALRRGQPSRRAWSPRRRPRR